METLRELVGIFWDIWRTGNRWARWAIGIIAVAPFTLFAEALVGVPSWIIAILALVPAGAFVVLLLTRIDPLILAVLEAFVETRPALRWIFNVVGAESAMGIYFALVPIGNDRRVASLLILAFVTFFFLSLGTKGKWAKRTMAACILIIIAITAQFFYDWTGRVREWMTQSKAAAQIPAVFQRNGHIDENGYYHPPQKTTQEMPAKIANSVDCNDEKTECHVIMNCNADLLVMDNIEPDEVVEVEHVVHHLEKENRCTYSYAGDWYPMWGALGMVYDPNLGTFPIPEYYGMAPHAIYFEMRDNINNAPLTAGVITRLGGKSYPSNTSPSTATISTGYNYPKAIRFDPKYNVQFGVGKSFVELVFRKKPKGFILPYEEGRS